jgi:hypothetical protein
MPWPRTLSGPSLTHLCRTHVHMTLTQRRFYHALEIVNPPPLSLSLFRFVVRRGRALATCCISSRNCLHLISSLADRSSACSSRSHIALRLLQASETRCAHDAQTTMSDTFSFTSTPPTTHNSPLHSRRAHVRASISFPGLTCASLQAAFPRCPGTARGTTWRPLPAQAFQLNQLANGLEFITPHDLLEFIPSRVGEQSRGREQSATLHVHTDRRCGPRKVSHIIMVEGYLLFPITQHTSWSHHHRALALFWDPAWERLVWETKCDCTCRCCNAALHNGMLWMRNECAPLEGVQHRV